MDRRILYIWLSKINGVGPVIASKLIEFFGRIDFVYEAKYDDLIKVEGIGPITAKTIVDNKDLTKSEQIFNKCNKNEIKIVTRECSNYPKQLKIFDKAPIVLYVRGNLKEIKKDHPVMLNRAPTLHRLGIQAFEPVLVEGRAIKLHPLVCTAFNADFDGDQMAIHLPLSPEAQAEARYLMLSTNNLLKPQDGKTVTVPTIDMVFGGYYLTMVVEGELGEGKYFKDPEEAIMAYENHAVGMHAKILVRRTLKIDGELKSKRIETTVGRILYNDGIPQDLGYKDRTNPEEMFQYEIDFPVNQKKLGAIIDRCIRIHGLSISAELLDNIKDKGFKYCTQSGLTYSMGDVKVPEDKPQILAEADAKVSEIRKKYRRGLITEEERFKEVVAIWNEATVKVGKSLEDRIEEQNPINLMVKSGARGNINQLRQAAAMRGLMAGTTGKVIEIPIKSCFAEGLRVLYFFSPST